MDEGYFMYFEEVDFCLAARRAGFACWYVPASRVVHLVGLAGGHRLPQRPQAPPGVLVRVAAAVLHANHGRLYALLADPAWATAVRAVRVRRVIQRKPDADPPRSCSDFVRHSTCGRRAAPQVNWVHHGTWRPGGRLAYPWMENQS